MLKSYKYTRDNISRYSLFKECTNTSVIELNVKENEDGTYIAYLLIDDKVTLTQHTLHKIGSKQTIGAQDVIK